MMSAEEARATRIIAAYERERDQLWGVYKETCARSTAAHEAYVACQDAETRTALRSDLLSALADTDRAYQAWDARVWKRAAKERHAALMAEYVKVKAALEVAGMWQRQCEAAERRARANEAEAAQWRELARAALIDSDLSPQRAISYSTRVKIEQALEATPDNSLAAALDAWRAFMERLAAVRQVNVSALAEPPERALYQAWRGQGNE
jgi:hypothetical protein